MTRILVMMQAKILAAMMIVMTLKSGPSRLFQPLKRSSLWNTLSPLLLDDQRMK